MESLKGRLLVAVPSLFDPNFRKTVVLICQHDADGALGVVLNRPLSVSIDQAWGDISELPCEHDGPLYYGGPCQQALSALHAGGGGDIQAMPGVSYSMSQEQIEALITGQTDPVRFFVGYSGWSPGQLESEMAAGGWLTAPATRQWVFDDEPDLYDRVMRVIAQGMLKVAGLPEDPQSN